MKRRGGVAAFVAAATLVLAACSPGSGDDAATVTLLTQPQQASSAPVVSVVDPAYPRVVDGAVVYTGQVVRWVDGDTIDLLLHARTGRDTWTVTKTRGRVAHIDTPETRGSTREAGLAAKTAAERLAPNGSPVTVHDQGVDKYGRVLVQITNREGVNVGSELLRTGHAEPYEGGAK